MKKLLPIVAIIFLGTLYLALRTYFTPQRADINLVAAPSPSPYVALAFDPSFITTAANTKTKLGITLAMSPEFSAQSANLNISYSNNCLSPVLTTSTDFPILVGPVGVGSGTIRAKVITRTPVRDSAVVAYLTTGPKAGGDCSLSFGNQTTILAPNNNNILTSTVPAMLKLKTVDPNLPVFKQPVSHPDTLIR